MIRLEHAVSIAKGACGILVQRVLHLHRHIRWYTQEYGLEDNGLFSNAQVNYLINSSGFTSNGDIIVISMNGR